MKQRITILALLAGLMLSLLALPTSRAAALSGSSFQANNIIDDSIFYNSGAMSVGQIQSFLNAKVPVCDTNGTGPSGVSGYPTVADYGNAHGYPPPYPCLKDYVQAIAPVAADAYCGALAGGTYSAAVLIFNVAQACGINPQTLLVTLQKEEGLVADTWPMPNQYRIAMGYGCPDTAACDTAYYGFFNQIYNASRQFQRYFKLSNQFNYRAGQTSYVLYNPNSACGGTNLTLQSRATAGLYNYTPYQPNQAALANLNGGGDACSAFGNRNFWRYFNEWFGTTRGQSFTLVKPAGGTTQYVLCNNTLYSVGSLQLLLAWGLDRMGPATDVDPAYLSSLPVGDTLSRLVRPDNSWAMYMVDNGNKWVFPSAEMVQSWGFNAASAANIPGVVASYLTMKGNVSYSVKSVDNTTQYMMDNSALRSYVNVATLKAWEGEGPPPVTEVSAAFLNTYSTGSALNGFKFSAGGIKYLADNGKKYTLNSDLDALYNFAVNTVSQTTADRLSTIGLANQFIRQYNQPTIYFVDNGVKRAVAGPNYVNAYSNGGVPRDIQVTSGFAALIPTGAPFESSLIAKQGSQYYLVDGRKLPIDSTLLGAYSGATVPPSVNTNLLNMLPTAGTATRFIKAANSPVVYLLDNGSIRSVRSLENFVLWNGPAAGVTEIKPENLALFAAGQSIGNYVSNTGNNYLIIDGNRYTVDSTTQTNWGLSNPVALSNGGLALLNDAGSLPSKVKVNGTYYLLRGGKAYATTNLDMAGVWSIDDAAAFNPLALIGMPQLPLSRFVRSTDPTNLAIYTVEKNTLYALKSIPAVFNLGYSGEVMVALTPQEITARGVNNSWDNILGKDALNTVYIFDGGLKRRFADTASQNQWTSNGAYTVLTMSNNFLNLLPNNTSPITKSLRANEPAVYAVINGTKQHILSPFTVIASYAPTALVSADLRDSLPTGAPIP